MPHAIRIYRTGGPEVMVWEDIRLGNPGPAEARIRHTAVGLNFVDIYHRTGLYPTPLPSGLGGEGAGIVEAVGSEVSDLKPGDRVACRGRPWIEVKAGHASPFEFDWFSRTFSSEKLLVVSSDRFDGSAVRGVTLDDFLLDESL
jgi:hypothetical protein